KSQFRNILDQFLDTVSSNPQMPRMTFVDTHLGGAADESPETQVREDRHRALMQYFFATLFECAEDIADGEIAPIDATATEPRSELRPESLYYEYHLARKSAYAGFSAEQRKAVKGLVLRTAFETMFHIALRLQSMSEHEVDILLRPKCAPDIEHPLHATD